jgi:hypothetical protein
MMRNIAGMHTKVKNLGLTQLVFLYPRPETKIPEYIRYAKTLVRCFRVVPHVVFSHHFQVVGLQIEVMAGVVGHVIKNVSH